MSNPNSIPDPAPSISAQELRRRLLSSTPPPMNPPSANTIDNPHEEGEQKPQSGVPVTTESMLRKLRVPIGAAAPAPVPEVPAEEPAPAFHSKMAAFGRRASSFGNGAYSGYGMDPSESPNAEVQRLKAENKELRQLLGEMKVLLQEASDSEQKVQSLRQEVAEELTEKEAQIEALTEQLHAIEEQIADGTLAHAQPNSPPKSRTELEEWTEELEQEANRLNQERKRMDDERRQLREDEESLEKQMRDMEVSMARERALMARQETELKRLSAEIQHELEIMQRGDANLREQMQKFQRRAQEVLQKPGGQPEPQQWGRR
jgi:hypothetical protein